MPAPEKTERHASRARVSQCSCGNITSLRQGIYDSVMTAKSKRLKAGRQFPKWGLAHSSRVFCGRWASAPTTICRECMSNQSGIKSSAVCISSRSVAIAGCQPGWKGWSRSNRNGLRGGEKRVSCSWGEPILPPRTREGWGNLVSRLDCFALWRAKINPRWWMTLLWGLTEAAIIAPTDAPDLWHETRSL